MTDEEEFTFCGTTCMAARRLGIYGRLDSNGFIWFDPMNGMKMPVYPRESDKKTLVAACEALIEILSLIQPSATNERRNG